MKTYSFEAYSNNLYNNKKQKGYIKAKDEWKAKVDLMRRDMIPIDVTRSSYETDKDFEIVVELTTAQKLAEKVSSFIIWFKQYIKDVKEGW